MNIENWQFEARVKLDDVWQLGRKHAIINSSVKLKPAGENCATYL